MSKAMSLTKVPDWMIYPILEGIPFYKNVLQKEPEQLKFMLLHSKIMEVSPGTVVIRKGEFDSTVYFVLMGQLLVFFDHNTKFPIGYISPGEMFGEIAMIRELKRQATVVADSNSKKVLLMSTDFSPFGSINDFDKINLETKLLFYHSVVDITRERLVSFCLNYPTYDIAKKKLESLHFKGKRGTREELNFLHQASISLAKALNEWNSTVGNIFFEKGEAKFDTIENLIAIFDQN